MLRAEHFLPRVSTSVYIFKTRTQYYITIFLKKRSHNFFFINPQKSKLSYYVSCFILHSFYLSFLFYVLVDCTYSYLPSLYNWPNSIIPIFSVYLEKAECIKRYVENRIIPLLSVHRYLLHPDAVAVH